MAQTGDHSLSRRHLLAGLAACPAVSLSRDPDAALVAAWDELCAIERQINAAEDDHIIEALDAQHEQLECLIARSPCHSHTGMRVKMQLLAHLFEVAGPMTDWELDLTRSALAYLAD